MVSQAFGYSVTLVCAVEAFPPADISWSHQSILKSDNEDNLSIDNGRSEDDDNKSVYRGILGTDGFTSSSLRVNRLRPEDLGAYTCTANNKLGRTTHIITVRPGGLPLILTTDTDHMWGEVITRLAVNTVKPRFGLET